MNDLELMYLLEEEGYEPTLENLKTLKEESDIKKLKKIRRADNKDVVDNKNIVDTADLNIRDKAAKREHRWSAERCEMIRRKNNQFRESFSDYELYQILDENGYVTNEENLYLLKEGLETGEYIIEAGLRSARVAFNAATYRQNGVADARTALKNGRRRFDAAVAAVRDNPGDEISRRIVNDGPEIERRDSRNLKNAKRDRTRETIKAFFDKDTERKPKGNTASSERNNQAPESGE